MNPLKGSRFAVTNITTNVFSLMAVQVINHFRPQQTIKTLIIVTSINNKVLRFLENIRNKF